MNDLSDETSPTVESTTLSPDEVRSSMKSLNSYLLFPSASSTSSGKIF